MLGRPQWASGKGQARSDLEPRHCCFSSFPLPTLDPHPELGGRAETLTPDCASPSQREKQPAREA